MLCNVQLACACMQKTKLTAVKNGRFPSLQFYCSLHKTFGVKAWLVHTGSKGGKKTLKPWDGVDFWTAELEEWERQMIVEVKYFNRPEAVAKKEKEDPQFFAGPFDPKKFLVRAAIYSAAMKQNSCCRQQCCSARRKHITSSSLCTSALQMRFASASAAEARSCSTPSSSTASALHVCSCSATTTTSTAPSRPLLYMPLHALRPHLPPPLPCEKTGS